MDLGHLRIFFSGKRNGSSLTTGRTVIFPVTVLFTNLSIYTVYNNFLSVVFCTFTSTIKCFTLCWKETRSALGFFLGCCPIIAPFYNMDIFPHIKYINR